MVGPSQEQAVGACPAKLQHQEALRNSELGHRCEGRPGAEAHAGQEWGGKATHLKAQRQGTEPVFRAKEDTAGDARCSHWMKAFPMPGRGVWTLFQ